MVLPAHLQLKLALGMSQAEMPALPAFFLLLLTNQHRITCPTGSR